MAKGDFGPPKTPEQKLRLALWFISRYETPQEAAEACNAAMKAINDLPKRNPMLKGAKAEAQKKRGRPPKNRIDKGDNVGAEVPVQVPEPMKEVPQAPIETN